MTLLPEIVKTLREKEKMLVTSLFSFFHNVSKCPLLQDRSNPALCVTGLNVNFKASATREPIVARAE